MLRRFILKDTRIFKKYAVFHSLIFNESYFNTKKWFDSVAKYDFYQYIILDE